MLHRPIAFLISVFLIAANYACFGTSPLIKDLDVTRDLQRAVCSSLTLYGTGGRGSATLIKYEGRVYILTALHVVSNNIEEPVYEVIDREVSLSSRCLPITFKAYVIAGDSSTDLALLVPQVDGPELYRLSSSLARTSPKMGEKVWCVGSPLSILSSGKFDHNITKGVLSKKFKKAGILVYRTDADVFFGNSGGGLFNEDLDLIGVSSTLQILPPFGVVPGSAVFVSHEEISFFLQAASLLP